MSLLFVIDLETTALEPQDGCVWSIGGAAVQDGRVVSEWGTAVRPSVEHFQARHREVVRTVSGLSDGQMLELLDALPLIEARREFLGWMFRTADLPYPCRDEDWKTFGDRRPLRVTSYNRAFEEKWLRVSPWQLDYFAHALAPAEWCWSECVMEQAAQSLRDAGVTFPGRNGRPRYPKLTEACQHYGISLPDAHQALADARAAAELAICLGME